MYAVSACDTHLIVNNTYQCVHDIHAKIVEKILSSHADVRTERKSLHTWFYTVTPTVIFAVNLYERTCCTWRKKRCFNNVLLSTDSAHFFRRGRGENDRVIWTTTTTAATTTTTTTTWEGDHDTCYSQTCQFL